MPARGHPSVRLRPVSICRVSAPGNAGRPSTADTFGVTSLGSGWRSRFWPVLAVAAATVPSPACSRSRESSSSATSTLAFRSRFLFLRHSVFSGAWPFWDPYPANGQSAVNDALYQLFHLPSLPIRLLAAGDDRLQPLGGAAAPAGGVGHVPLSAPARVARLPRRSARWRSPRPGRWSRRRTFPNMSWSVAAVPVRVLGDRSRDSSGRRRPARRRCSRSSWPARRWPASRCSLAATLAIAAAYVVCVDHGWARRARRWSCPPPAWPPALLLSAVQYVPLGRGGPCCRCAGLMRSDDFWAFHPLTLHRAGRPALLRRLLHSRTCVSWSGWWRSTASASRSTTRCTSACRSCCGGDRRAVRPPTDDVLDDGDRRLSCSARSARTRRSTRRCRRWFRRCRSFRFPVKYLSLGCVRHRGACGVGASVADRRRRAAPSRWSGCWPRRRDKRRGVRRRRLGAGGAGDSACGFFYRLALWCSVPFPMQGAEYLIFRARPLRDRAPPEAALRRVPAVGWRPRRDASAGPHSWCSGCSRWSICCLPTPASTRRCLPTGSPSRPGPGRCRRTRTQRVYIGGRLFGDINSRDMDAPKYATGFETLSDMERRYMTVERAACITPSGLADPRADLVRSAGALADRLCAGADTLPAGHARGAAAPGHAQRRTLRRPADAAGARRARRWRRFVASSSCSSTTSIRARRGRTSCRRADRQDVEWQLEGMFQARFDPRAACWPASRRRRRAAGPEPRRRHRPRSSRTGSIASSVRAGLPQDGYLALLDSYDPDWKVDVDGQPAPLMRANGLFRAVHLNPGDHTVTFRYRPRALITWVPRSRSRRRWRWRCGG